MFRLLRSTLIFVVFLTGALATEAHAGVFDIPDVTIGSFQFRAFQDDTTGLVWLDIDNFWENGWSYELIESFLSGSGFHLATMADLNLLQTSVPDFVTNFKAVSKIMGGNYLGNTRAKEARGLLDGVYDDGINDTRESIKWQYEGEQWSYQPTIIPRDIVLSEMPDACGSSGCFVKYGDLGAWVVSDPAPQPQLIADFSANPTKGPAPLTVNFTDQSTGSITSWEWDFGDGSTSTMQSPSHTYTDPVIYTVSLTVTGPKGSDTETKTNYIKVAHSLKRAEIIGAWSSGLWILDVVAFEWTQMASGTPDGDIAAGDFTGDGKADVASIWGNGLWYQDGATLGWTKVSSTAPDSVTAGDVTGDGRFEIIGTWSNGIWYWDVTASNWTRMTSSTPTGDIAAGDFTGDRKADVASIWGNGIWYQDGATLDWTKVSGPGAIYLTAGDVTGDGRSEIISTWSNGIWYWDGSESKWTKMAASTPTGDIAAGDFTGDGSADVASIWGNGLWYQDGATLDWTKVSNTAPTQLTVGDVTGD